MITIFTPTFNRARTLPKLYESLKTQTDKDFEWLIVDDGSKDETEKLIKDYVDEDRVKIRYFFQENKGKHFAVNQGLKLAEGDYFVNIDSDDYLLPNAVAEMKNLAAETHNEDVAGFTFIHFSEKIIFNPEEYGKKRIYKPKVYHWEHHGEMMYCLKTDIYKQFPFPEFDGEKFCPESIVLRRIEKKYKILYTDKVLAKGEYLEGGLSSNYYKMMFNSPHGALLGYKEKIDEETSFDVKLETAKTYYDIAWKSKQTTLKEKFFNLSPILTLSVLWLKISAGQKL